MRFIRSIAELREAPNDRFLNGFGARGMVRIAIPGASAADQARLQKRLNSYQARCGCVSAAICLLATLAMSIVYLTNAELRIFSLTFVGRVVALFFGSVTLSLAAKLLVLQLTRLQFAHTCARFARQLSVT